MHVYLCDRNLVEKGEETIRRFAAEYAQDMNMGHLQNALETAQIARNPAGKPYFSNIPEIHFSPSHSGSVWGCAFDLSPLGFDLEDRNRLELKLASDESKRQQRWLKIARRFFSAEEYEYVKAGGEEAFFRIWVRKEAYVKYQGTGLLTGAGRIRMVADGELLADLSHAYVEELVLSNGLIGAYCSAEKRTIDRVIDCRESRNKENRYTDIKDN